jgi:hypothetical protein
MEFSTVVELNGKTATGLEVPADVVAALASGKKPRVTVTIGPHTYRSTIAVYDGRRSRRGRPGRRDRRAGQ